jgi:hypothetical protein
MADVPIPFVDENVDTDDGARGILTTLVVLIAGFAAFAWAQDVGGFVASKANSYISNLVGVDPTSGENTQEDPLF